MECKFHVGQRVVCVVSAEKIARAAIERPDVIFPENNAIYTIREMFFSDANAQVGVRLVEIRNQIILTLDGWMEPGFRTSNFRPVQEKKTDISVFTAMLNPSKIEEPA